MTIIPYRAWYDNYMERKGFTLIELLVTVGIIVVLGIASALLLSGRKNTADLSSADQQVGTILREAQSRAATQASDATWGVYFGNPTSTRPFFALFSGTSYSASGTLEYYALAPDVCYVTSSIPSGSSTQVTFTPVTGTPSASATIVLGLSTGGCGKAATTTVTVSSQGEISY